MDVPNIRGSHQRQNHGIRSYRIFLHQRQNHRIHLLHWCVVVGAVIFCCIQTAGAAPRELPIKGGPSFLHSSLGEPSSVQRTVEPTPVVPRALKSQVITSSQPRRKDILRRSRRSPHPYSQFVYNSSHPSYYPVSPSYSESQPFLEYNPGDSNADNESVFHRRGRYDRPPSSPVPRYRRGPTQPIRAWRNYVLEDFLQYIGSGEGSTEEWHHQSRDTAWLELQSSPIKMAPLPTYAYLQSPHFISSSTSPSRITVVSTVYKTSTEYATTLYSTRTPLVTATVQSASAPSATWQELYTSCTQHVAALESGQNTESVLSSTPATGNKIQYQTETMFVTSIVTSILIETKTVTDPASEISITSSLDLEPTVPIIIAPSPTITYRLPETSPVILLTTSSDELDAGATEFISFSPSPGNDEIFTSHPVSNEEPTSSLPTLTSPLIVPTTESSIYVPDTPSTVPPSYYSVTERSIVNTEPISSDTSSLTENTTELALTASYNMSTFTESETDFSTIVTEPVPFVVGSSTPSNYENNTSTDGRPPSLDREAVSGTLSSTTVTETLTHETPTEIPIRNESFFYNTVDSIITDDFSTKYSTDYTTEYLFDRTSVSNVTGFSSTTLSSQTLSTQDLNPMLDTEPMDNASTSSISVLYEDVSDPVSFPSTTIERDSTTMKEVDVYIEGSGIPATTSSSSTSETSGIKIYGTETTTSETLLWSTNLSYSSSSVSPPHTTITEIPTVLLSSSTAQTFEITELPVPFSNISIELQPSSSSSPTSSSPKIPVSISSSPSTSLTDTTLGSTTETTSATTQQTARTSTTQPTSRVPTTASSKEEAILSEEATTESSTSTTLLITAEVETIDNAFSDESVTEPATTPLSSFSSTVLSTEVTTTSTPTYTMNTGIDDVAPDPEFWIRTIIEGKLRDADIEENKIETGLSKVFRSAFGYGRNEDSELLKNLGEPVNLNIPRSDDPLTENRVRRDILSFGFANPSVPVSKAENLRGSYFRRTNHRDNILNNQIAPWAKRRKDESFVLSRRRRQLRPTSSQETDKPNPSSLSQGSEDMHKANVAQYETAFLARNIENINAKIHNVSHNTGTNKTDIIYVVYDGSTPIPADEAVASLKNIINERMSDAIGYKVHLTEEYLRNNEETSPLTWLESNVWIWYVLAVIILILLITVFITTTYCLYWKKRPYKSGEIPDAEERRSGRTFATEADVEASTSGRTSAPTMDAGEESSSSSRSSPRDGEEEDVSVLRPQIRKSRQLRDSGEVTGGPSGWRSTEAGPGGPSHRHLPPPRLPRLAAPMHNLPYADLPPSILRPHQFKHQTDPSSEEGTSAPETDTDENAFLGRPGSYRRIRKRFHELLADAFNILDGGQKADRVDSLTGQENSAIEHDAPLPRAVPSTSGRGSAPPSAPAELGRPAGGGAPWKTPDPYQVPRPRSAADLLQHTRVQPLDHHISPSAGTPVSAWGEAGLGGSRPGSARCITPVNLPTNSSPPSRGPASPPHTTSAGEAALAESLGLKVGDPAVPLIMDIKETLNTLKARGVQRPRRQRYYEGPSQEAPQQ